MPATRPWSGDDVSVPRAASRCGVGLSVSSAVTLVLDTSQADGRVGFVGAGGEVLAEAPVTGLRGLSETLPLLVASLGSACPAPAAIACVVGPGSFTGCRAGLAFAHGMAIGSAIPVIGVTVGEAIRAVVPGPVWIATGAGEARVFLDRDGVVEAFALACLPMPDEPATRVAGDAAVAVAAVLGLPLARRLAPSLPAIAAAARARSDGRLPPRDALPLYVDPPRTTVAAGAATPPMPDPVTPDP